VIFAPNFGKRARLRVKFMAKEHARGRLAPFQRQLPRATRSWGNCQFIFDPDARDYDWLVCYDDLAPHQGERFSTRIEPLACPRQHTMFITVEPSSIKVYGRDFLAQFGVVLTSQEPWAIGVPNAVFSQPALRWYYGVGGARPRDLESLRAGPPPTKGRLLSTVCSNKRHQCTLHARRFAYTRELADRLPELQVYGRGVRPVEDKADAVDPYRYHLAVENHLAPHHWTEKLADAFLGAALPFYVGCPNVAEYFPAESVVALPIDDAERSAAIIRETMRRDLYQTRRAAILEARRRVLEQYNLFAVIARLIEQHHDPTARPVAHAEMLSRHALRNGSVVVALRFAVERMRTRGRSRRLVRQFVSQPPRVAEETP
jgi:hypothetical protein